MCKSTIILSVQLCTSSMHMKFEFVFVRNSSKRDKIDVKNRTTPRLFCLLQQKQFGVKTIGCN